MKKKLMAMLVAAAMLVCMMPAMAFADEAPAEEQVVQATEEVVVPEAAEEDAVAPETDGAVLEDEAVVEEAVVEEAVVEEDAKYDGSWNGWVFTFTGNEAGAAKLVVLLGSDLGNKQVEYAVKLGENDFSALAEQEAAKGASTIIFYIADPGTWATMKDGQVIKTKVVVDKAASKDTIFTYAIDNIVTYKEKVGGGIFTEIKPAKETGFDYWDLFGNTITLKAGQTSAEGYLYHGFDAIISEDPEEKEFAFLITEKGNDGGYTTDTSVWAWVPNAVSLGAKGDFARFDSLSDVQALLDKINASDYKTGEELLLAEFQYEEPIFTHTATAKGVQTGDSNSLGLWVVVMAVAGVAAAAVALKRREN